MIYIITGPSGVGKNTIIEAMSTDLDFYFSVTLFEYNPCSCNIFCSLF